MLTTPKWMIANNKCQSHEQANSNEISMLRTKQMNESLKQTWPLTTTKLIIAQKKESMIAKNKY